MSFLRRRRRSPAPQPSGADLNFPLLCCVICGDDSCRPRVLPQPKGQAESLGLALVYGICPTCEAVPGIDQQVVRKIAARITFHPQSPPGDRAST